MMLLIIIIDGLVVVASRRGKGPLSHFRAKHLLRPIQGWT
jgi:hypothetical protein